VSPDSADKLTVDVQAFKSSVDVRLKDGRAGIGELFAELSEDGQLELARDAWVVGLRALRNAYAQAQEAKLRDVGKTLLDDVDRQLGSFLAQQKRTVADVLEKYFDPQGGQVSERLREFVDDQGRLATLLKQYLGTENSVLVRTLSEQVGKESPLFKALSPTESDGLVKTLEARLSEALAASQADVAKALDPLNRDSAVARFMGALKDQLKDAEASREKQLAALTAAIDANDEDSLLNNLARQSAQLRQQLMAAINPELPDSPMAMMSTTLSTLLSKHIKSQEESAEQARQRQEEFERRVLDVVSRLEGRRSEEAKSPSGGFDFEDAVYKHVVDAASGGAYTVEGTGSTVGSLRNCKKGDTVIRFAEEHAFAGSAVVVEAKRDGSYTVSKAIEEMEIAKKNRGADSAVFVMASSHAPEGFPRCVRYGSTVLVTWDAEDPTTSPFLDAAIWLGMALVRRHRKNVDQGDINALADAQQRIEAEIERLEKMAKNNETIRKNSDAIGEHIRISRDKLGLLLRKAQKTLTALNVELVEEAAERETPIELGNAPGKQAA
jgi:hypothetical protein